MLLRGPAGSTRPLLLLSGKGGVGKTTIAAATALLLARRGVRTLLVSTDPAHSIGDILGAPLSGTPSAIAPRLEAVEIDAEAAADAHVDGIRATLAGSVDPQLLPAVHRHLDLARSSPGTVEAALFDRMAELMEHCPERYDRIVFDTAPSGHTLRLLTLPALLSAWVEGLARQRERVAGLDRMLANMAGDERARSDPVLERLHQRRGLLQRAGERLRDDAAVWLVLNPARLAIEETDRTDRLLSDGGLAVEGLVVNRVLPAEADGAFLTERRDQEAEHLTEIRRRFRHRPLIEVPQQPRDVTGAAGLAAIAESLDADPA